MPNATLADVRLGGPPLSLNLLSYFIPDSDEERFEEYCVTLRLNAANPLVRTIRLLHNAQSHVGLARCKLSAEERTKVSTVPVDYVHGEPDPLTFARLLREAKHSEHPEALSVMLNGDIVLGDWSSAGSNVADGLSAAEELRRIAPRMRAERIAFALSRSEPRRCFPLSNGQLRVHRSLRKPGTCEGCGIFRSPDRAQYKNICSNSYLAKRSRDALVFNALIPEATLSALNFPGNRLGSENLLSCRLAKAGFRLSNPCRALPIIHNHCSDVRGNMSKQRIDTTTQGCYVHIVSTSKHIVSTREAGSVIKSVSAASAKSAPPRLSQPLTEASPGSVTPQQDRSSITAWLCARQAASTHTTPDLSSDTNISRKCCVKGSKRPPLHFHSTASGNGWGGGGSQVMQAFQRALDGLSAGDGASLAARHVLNAGSHGHLVNQSVVGCQATHASILGANMLLARPFVPLSCWFEPPPCPSSNDKSTASGSASALASASLPSEYGRFRLAAHLAALWLIPNARLRAQIQRLRSQIAAACPAMASDRAAHIGLHLRRGDRKGQTGEERMNVLTPPQVVAALDKSAASLNGTRSLPIVVIAMTDDPAALLEVRNALPQHLLLVSLEDVHSKLDTRMEPLDFMLSGLWLLAEADALLANSHSNIGSLLFMLAAAQRTHLPKITDFDGSWGRKQMLRGAFPCSAAWGPRKGLCVGVGSSRQEYDDTKGLTKAHPSAGSKQRGF